MGKQKETVLGWIIFAGLIFHYLFGYFFWDKIYNVNIYYISAYFLMDVMGLVIFIIATTKFLKGIGAAGMLFGSYYFYMEFRNPMVWNDIDYKGLPTLVLMILNLGFLWYYTDIFKRLKIKK